LGIELGSTRIKTILVDKNYQTLANGVYEWENKYENGVWTYSLDEVWKGIQSAYKELSLNFKDKYKYPLTKIGAIGVSGMMHGYIPFDSKNNLLVPFRTWRNTMTEKASTILSSTFQSNIPLRWSIAHLYQSLLNEERHVKKVNFLTTLSGYVHWMLTDEKVIGIGDASGMFHINYEANDYDNECLKQFGDLVASKGYSLNLKKILPKIKLAGENAGYLTDKGAKLLDITGTLQSKTPFCPPEGDAGTGMVATNTIKENTGNISAGTSIFAMITLSAPLNNYHKEVDIVTTPHGKPVAMIHCNNFTSEIDKWMNLFLELFDYFGKEIAKEEMFPLLFWKAMESDRDLGGMVSCNYHSGEPITGLEDGRPLLATLPNSNFTLTNFMCTQIYSALASLRLGMDILFKKENVKITNMFGHGGFFKTEKVSQQLMANAIKTPVSVTNTAGEGGAWGMALLASYSINGNYSKSLQEYLDKKVFVTREVKKVKPNKTGAEHFSFYLERYKSMLYVEQSAIEHLKK